MRCRFEGALPVDEVDVEVEVESVGGGVVESSTTASGVWGVMWVPCRGREAEVRKQRLTQNDGPLRCKAPLCTFKGPEG